MFSTVLLLLHHSCLGDVLPAKTIMDKMKAKVAGTLFLGKMIPQPYFRARTQQRRLFLESLKVKLLGSWQ
jgi:hypothetical protein